MPRTRLVWRQEEGYEQGETPVGPAWIDTLGADGRPTSSEKVEGGQWIAREQAVRLARENGHDLVLDE